MANFKGFAFVFLVVVQSVLESAANYIDLSSGGFESSQIVLNSDGSKAIIVQCFDDDNYVIQATNSTDGGSTWTTAIDLSTCGYDAIEPQIALSSNGSTAIVVWKKNYGDYSVIRVTTSNDGGVSWSTPVSLISSIVNIDDFCIAMSDDGSTAVVLWTGLKYIQSITTTDGGTSWSQAIMIDCSQQSIMSIEIAMSADGSHAVAVWSSYDGIHSMIKAFTTSTSGLTWNPTLCINADLGKPKIALSSNGLQAIIVWENYGNASCFIQSVQTFDGGITWGTPVNQSPANEYSRDPQIAMSADGSTATIVWRNSGSSTNLIQSTATIDGGTTWSSTIVVNSSQDSIAFPQIAMSSDGSNTIAVWSSLGSTISAIEAAIASNSGQTWTKPVNLCENTDLGQPKIALTSNGLQAIVVWENDVNANYSVQSSYTSDGGITWSTPVTTPPYK